MYSMTTKASTVRSNAISILDAAGIASPQVDSELLIGHILGLGRGEVQAKIALDVELSDEDATAIAGLVSRRATREPLQHITGWAPFRTLQLRVGPGVFVPRPETELVAQFAIDALCAVAGSQPKAVDLGTGSGAIAIAMAIEVPHAKVFAVERSERAYTWARLNVDESGADNLELALGDLADAFSSLNGTVSVVISNPPYVPDGAVPRDPEVRLFDPGLALYGGEDGLDVIRLVSRTALRLLHPGGTVVIEHGELQGGTVRDLLSADGWRAPSTHPDLLGRDRATTAIR